MFIIVFAVIGLADADAYNQTNLTIMPTINLDKCLCSECATASQGNFSIWVCDACLCPYYINDTWEFIGVDICAVKKIKWRMSGWILAVENKCTNIAGFGICNITITENVTTVSCK